MSRNEATDLLLEIMEVADDAYGDCDRCPFHNIIDDMDYDCPFVYCPGDWTV